MIRAQINSLGHNRHDMVSGYTAAIFFLLHLFFPFFLIYVCFFLTDLSNPIIPSN